MPNIVIEADWPEHADTHGWRVKEVVAVDERGMLHVLQVLRATKPIRLRMKKK